MARFRARLARPFGAAAFVLLAAAAGAIPANPCKAAMAVTVIGATGANECYRAALYGGSASAEAECTRAIEDGELVGRDLVATYVNRGIVRNQLRRLDDALADFNEAIGRDPELGAAYVNRGNTMFFLGRHLDALADYTTAIEKDTDDLHAAYYNRGLAYEVLKKPDLAEADFRKALELKPDFGLAQLKIEDYDAERIRKETAGPASGE